MPKQNRQQRRKDAKAKARLNRELQIHVQMALDAAMIAANETLGMGAGRAEKFAKAYQDNYMEIIRAFDDGAEYAFEVIDRRLKPVCGEKYRPWQTRYGLY